MPLLILGLLLFIAKLAEIGPTADWSWWLVLAPFAGAAAWWQFADSTGLTRRRAMKKMEDRKRERREKAMASLGLKPGPNRPPISRPADTPPPPASPAPAARPADDAPPPRRDPRL